MKNYIIKKTLNALANAPEIACKSVLQELPEEDKQDALRLFKALNVKIKDNNGDLKNERDFI